VVEVSVEFVFEKEVTVMLITDSGEFVANKVVESRVIFAALLDVTAVSDVGAGPLSDELPATVFVSASVVCGFVKVVGNSPTVSVPASPAVDFMYSM
jgi:hypothetical protein